MSRYPSSPPSSPPSICSSLSWSREPSPFPLAETETTLQHPFAATSSSAGKRPPRYDISRPKRTYRPVTPPVTPPKDTDANMHDDFSDSPGLRSAAQDGEPESSFDDADDELTEDMLAYEKRQRDEQVWNDTVSAAIDQVELAIDLSRHDLHHIDPCVKDLGDMVVLKAVHADASFSRVDSTATVTLPMSRVSSQPRIFSRTTTQSHTGALSLRLAFNSISILPPELFDLRQLVVLSLDGNGLKVLPGAIGRLESLKELNIARNLFTTLPVELDNLALSNFTLFPNNNLLRQPASETRTWPSLKELCLRKLCAPESVYLAQDLVDKYGMPLPEDLTQFFEPADATKCARLNTCAAHGNCFIEPGHTRVEFRNVLAGQRLSEQVPVLLRGCVPGCLDEPAAHPTTGAVWSSSVSTANNVPMDDQDDEFMEGFGEPVLRA